MRTAIIRDWFLSDGILAPIPLMHPVPVARALRDFGMLPEDLNGFALLHAEWIARRTWTYETTFSLPDTQAHCFLLEVDGWCGEMRAYLNDMELPASAPLAFDATAAVQPGSNKLRLVFAPCDDLAVRLPATGIHGPIWLRDRKGITHLSLAAAASGEGGIAFTTVLNAQTEGLVQLRYQLTEADSDVPVFEKCDAETLHTGENTVSAVFHPEKIPAGALTATVTVDNEAQTVAGEAQIDFFLPDVRVPVRAFCCPAPSPLRDADDTHRLIERLRAAGFNALSAPADGRLTNELRAMLAENGIAIIKEAAPVIAPGCAMQRPQMLTALANDEPFWPYPAPVWQLRGSHAPDWEDLSLQFDSGSADPPEQAAIYSRLLQALMLSDACRKNRGGLIAWTDGSTAEFAAATLFDADLRPRPAYFALRAAWAPQAAFAVLPEDRTGRVGQSLTLPIRLLADLSPALPLAVTCTIFTADGMECASVRFPAYPNADEKVGDISFSLPDTPQVLLVRTSVAGTDGSETRLEDILCATRAGDAPLSPVGSLARVNVRVEDGKAVNRGKFIAFFVSDGDNCQSLLPGESMPTTATRADSLDGVNLMSSPVPLRTVPLRID